MTILSTTAVSATTGFISHASGKTKIKVKAPITIENIGVYDVQWEITFPAPHPDTFTTTFKVNVVGCVVTSYTITGCVNLSQTLLDPSRIDSSCIITQVPACGYESTVSVVVVPNSVLTASVSSTNVVYLAIQ